jgi:hypothetical protein
MELLWICGDIYDAVHSSARMFSGPLYEVNSYQKVFILWLTCIFENRMLSKYETGF